MSESAAAPLLDLMRRVRRRWRWVAGLEGAARGIAAATFLLAAATGVARLAGHGGRRADGGSADVRNAALAIAAVVVVGAGAAAAAMLGRMSMTECARAVDRALGARDDSVLSAVALCGPDPVTNRFTTELMSQAVARARAAPAPRVIPPPGRRPLGLAAAGICLWAAATAVPARGLSASARRPPVARPVPPGTDEADGRLRMTTLDLAAEREDARAALLAAAGGDHELGRIAGAFDALLSDLAAGRLDAAAALARLGSLARAAADDARRAAAAKEAAALLGATAEGDHAGRAKAAAEASAALADAAHEAGAEGTPAAPAHAGHEPDAPARAPEPAQPVEQGASDEQRQLESLRRDLDDEAASADCQGDPARCRRQADDPARARAELERIGRTADARDRLAQSARQLQDRVQRGGASIGRAPSSSSSRSASSSAASPAPDGSDPDERFARAAAGRRDEPQGPEARGDVTSKATSPGSGETPARARQSAAAEAARANAATASGQTAGQGAGAGIGATPGGRVLGPRGAPAAAAGHDAPEALADADPDAPARAAIIGTAAGRGFAGAAYRPVYSEYRAAVEESLDSAAVPPGRRALVRRYFQLIRPRSGP